MQIGSFSLNISIVIQLRIIRFDNFVHDILTICLGPWFCTCFRNILDIRFQIMKNIIHIMICFAYIYGVMRTTTMVTWVLRFVWEFQSLRDFRLWFCFFVRIESIRFYRLCFHLRITFFEPWGVLSLDFLT